MPKIEETQVQSVGWEDPLEEENCNPLQDSCLGNPMEEEPGGRQSMGTVYGVTKGQTQLKQLSMPVGIIIMWPMHVGFCEVCRLVSSVQFVLWSPTVIE